MRTVSVSEAKNSLSALLREIRGGATVVITDRGVPVARLLPPLSGRGLPARAIDLAQQGRLILPERQPGTRWLDEPLPEPRVGASAVQALLDERESSGRCRVADAWLCERPGRAARMGTDHREG